MSNDDNVLDKCLQCMLHNCCKTQHQTAVSVVHDPIPSKKGGKKRMAQTGKYYIHSMMRKFYICND